MPPRFFYFTLTLLTSLMTTGCSLVGIRTSKTPTYTVLSQEGQIEIRQYGDSVIAETSVEGGYEEGGDTAFSRLGGYIFGGNKERRSISMTAPVYQEPATDNISGSEGNAEDVWTMSFVMPEDQTLETLPEPEDSLIFFKKVPGKKLAAIRYSGSLNKENIDYFTKILTEWLAQKNITTLSPARSAAFDPPWTIPLFRRNEIHIDIE